jgi:hypothetical protein
MAVTMSRTCLVMIYLLGVSGCNQSAQTPAAIASPNTGTINQVSTPQEVKVEAQKNDGGDQADAVIIPLDQIWALDMPGTHKMSTNVTATGEYATPGGELVRDIVLRALTSKKEGEQAKPAFAVVGSGLDALKQAHAVLVNGQEVVPRYSTDKEIRVVFFSHLFGWYVHLEQVSRRASTITIRYHFKPHRTKDSTRHIALIPLGKLPAGKYEVNITQLPLQPQFIDGGFKPLDESWAKRVVCRPFAFEVKESDLD